ncbi:ABC transporter ATP-binding protein [Luteolibacter pohnpeiensis]|uniref:ABC transporter ATP-binding protein n=1 Tax=Luteolibacter pohnpeiensis TaxID=454153 RepID=A0A934SBX9_9BACT|nr:ABC transporter ATP-binding protein [Luteolibacter pohnpeiensis]MBK1883089.1 ABC transporter ATP-binding protein [Luteolibacter pohnpeiensis]
MKPPETDSRGLSAEKLAVRYDRRLPWILDGTTLQIPEGKITAMIGPNGSGKSTLLKTLARQLNPEAGRVILDGGDLRQLPVRELAHRLGILFQEHPVPGEILVEDLVRHGRYSHCGFLQGLSENDLEAIELALRLTDLTDLRHRPVSGLSGGQRQLVWIAMALAQQPQYLFLDEPTTFLDLSHQFELMELMVRLNREHGKTIVLVLHDLNLAARYADHLIVMQQGKIVAEGPPVSILTPARLREVFEIEAQIFHSDQGWLQCLPIGKVQH